jgi:hypothetical protein
MFSPSIETVASVSRRIISRFCGSVKTPSMTLIRINGTSAPE